MKILLDTNILVYSHDPADESRQERSIQILDSLRIRRIGRISVQSLAEFCNAIIRPSRGSPPRLTLTEAQQAAGWLSAHFEVFPLTPLIVLEAMSGVRDYQLFYYDAQIWACARLNETSVIFSEDFQDGQILEGVQFINPFTPNFNLANWI
jgi:predicted nucleic acid-binding protein